MAEKRNRPNIWQKLRGRGFVELRVRGTQLLNARAERHGVSTLNRIPSDDEFSSLLTPDLLAQATAVDGLLEDFRNRTAPSFFAAFGNREETLKTLRRRFAPLNEAAVVERANRIMAGRFDLLGLPNLSFGQPINWRLEPITASTSPLIHWSQIDYLDSGQTGDKKITWELNRHQYFATLGRAYWYTGDEIYAKAFADQIQNWIEQNPPKLGINWASSLEVGFRSISWLWALHFFKDSKHLTSALFQQMLKLLYVHARHVENYLSTYFSPNTHLTGEALALFYLGLLLPQFRDAERWRAIGESILLRELDRQVRDDGVYFEQSSYYHRYTTDFYLHFLLLLGTNQQTVPAKLQARLPSLLDHLMYITRPDGTSPLFGDDDGGKLMILDQKPLDDFRSTLATGAVLFHRGDYRYVGQEASEEVLWLLGTDGLERLDRLEIALPASESRAFDQGGYYVMRDGWSPDSNYMLIDCGPLGGLRYGHAHADALSFELAAHGRTLLIDPGTYTYTGSKEHRDYFRSSAAHNTLTIDGESSSISDGPFSWRRVANSRALKWISRPRFDFFSGEHDGYQRLSSPAVHRRDVLFLKHDYWIIVDQIETDGAHQYDLHFHFAESASPIVDSGSAATTLRERQEGEEGVEIFVGASRGSWNQATSWVSRRYRQRSAAAAPTFTFRSEGIQNIVTFLVPRSDSQSRINIRSLEATGGSAFEFINGAGRDLLILGKSHVTGKTEVASDCGLAWLRFSSGSYLQELVLLDGENLAVNGTALVGFSKPVSYLAATRVADELIGETATMLEWRAPLRGNGDPAHKRLQLTPQ